MSEIRSLPQVDRTMKAIVQHGYGPANELRLTEMDTPDIGDDEVLVRVKAASIGAWVAHVVAGDPLAMRLQFGLRHPRKPIPESDIAGQVVAVGARVDRLQPGDEVYGECRAAFSEYAAASVDDLSAKPTNLTFEQAAAVPIAGQTALLGLREYGHLESGQHVLIIGAGGGVGTFAVQIAKAMEAEITGVCSSRSVELVRSLGADHVIDYTKQDFTAADQKYDLILQFAGTQSLSDLRRVLTERGTLILSSGEGGRWVGPLPRFALALLLSPFVKQRLAMYMTSTDLTNLRHLTELIETKKVSPIVDRIYPLSEMPAALRHFQEPHGQGKTVVTI